MVGLMSQQCAAAWLLVWWCYSWIQGGEGGERLPTLSRHVSQRWQFEVCVGTSSWRRWHQSLIQQKVKVILSKLSFSVLDFGARGCFDAAFFPLQGWYWVCVRLNLNNVNSVSHVFLICGSEEILTLVQLTWRTLQEAWYLFSDQKSD